MGGNDQRVYQRHRRRLSIRYCADSTKVWHRGFSSDVAVCGMFILSDQVPEPGTKMQLEMDLPGEGTVRLRGETKRGRRVTRGLHQIAKGGFALELNRNELPESWYRFLFSLEQKNS